VRAGAVGVAVVGLVAEQAVGGGRVVERVLGVLREGAVVGAVRAARGGGARKNAR
jgi:hypothetical protein